jgi:clan AA aspartic protease (TIGR02281 family)
LSFLNSKRSQTEKFRFVFDTGAEVFSIGFNLFNKLKEEGLLYDDLGVIMETVGVKGESMQNKVIRIKEINIGQYKLKNVIAFVKTLETANSSLLGIGFLNKFSEVQWSLISNQLILYK